jgi:hypothetical protein
VIAELFQMLTEVLPVRILDRDHQTLAFLELATERHLLCGKIRDPLGGVNGLLARNQRQLRAVCVAGFAILSALGGVVV